MKDNLQLNHLGSINIETDRLILRKLKISDANQVYKNWTSDKEVAKYMRWSTHQNVQETEKWLEIEEENYKRNDYYLWGIELKETGELIGSLGAYIREDEDNRYEIGYNLSKKYWNKGYATEAVKGMINYLQSKVGIKRFICKHAKENIASGAVIKKIGFRYIKDDYYESINNDKKYNCNVYYLDV